MLVVWYLIIGRFFGFVLGRDLFFSLWITTRSLFGAIPFLLIVVLKIFICVTTEVNALWLEKTRDSWHFCLVNAVWIEQAVQNKQEKIK